MKATPLSKAASMGPGNPPRYPCRRCKTKAHGALRADCLRHLHIAPVFQEQPTDSVRRNLTDVLSTVSVTGIVLLA